ncbi:MAG: SpoIIE family protein phosphatase [Anaerolineales bacterium]|nr:SpoIIE family protein phosphatase [Anaerolineales bacterium]
MAIEHDPTQELKTLAEIGNSIASAALDLQELAEVAFIEIARLMETDFFQLGVFEDDHYRTLIWVKDGSRQENLIFQISPEQEGLIGWIRRTGQSLLIKDFQSEVDSLPAHPSYDAPDPPVSGLFIPLISGESVIGALTIQSRRSHAFTEHDLYLMRLISNQLAPLLANLILQSETETLSIQMLLIREMSRLLISLDPIALRLSRITTLLTRVLEYEKVEIYEFIEGKLFFRASSQDDGDQADENELQSWLIDKVAKSGEPLNTANEDAHTEETPMPSALEYAYPMKIVDRVFGVLLIQCVVSRRLPIDHIAVIEMITTQLAFAILEARNYNQHQEEAWITTVLLEVARHAARPGETMSALQAVLQLSTLLTGMDWTILLLPYDSHGDLRIGPVAGLRRSDSYKLHDLHIQTSELGISPPYSESHEPFLITLPPALAEPLATDEASCLVLSAERELLGVLLLKGQEFSGKLPALLAGIGHQLSLRLENTRLIEEAAHQQSLERELAMARSIQISFMPEDLPIVDGWEIAADWQSAREVGGDFFDIIPLPDGENGPRWGIVIADVADKGIPAALYMALSKTLIHTIATEQIDPARTLEKVNNLLISETSTDLFVSAFYTIWEPELGRLIYSNAGHNPPLLFTPETSGTLIRDHGIVLGVEANAEYSSSVFEMKPGQLLVLYTDGVTEAYGGERGIFGLSRLRNLVLGLEDWGANNVVEAIVKRVIQFRGQPDLSDDLTVLILRCQER